MNTQTRRNHGQSQPRALVGLVGIGSLLILLANCALHDQTSQVAQPVATALTQVLPEPTMPPFSTPTPPTPTYAAVAPVDATFYQDHQFVESMRQQLLRTDLDPETRRGIEKALWIEDKDAIARATAVVRSQPTPSGPPSPNPSEPPPPRGIIEGASGPFSSNEFDVHNMWQDEIDGYWWVVYAGADGQDNTQGLLVAYKIIQRVPTKTQGGRYTTPKKTGYLRITSVKNMLVSVVAEDGSTYTFDLYSRAWIP